MDLKENKYFNIADKPYFLMTQLDSEIKIRVWCKKYARGRDFLGTVSENVIN